MSRGDRKSYVICEQNHKRIMSFHPVLFPIKKSQTCGFVYAFGRQLDQKQVWIKRYTYNKQELIIKELYRMKAHFAKREFIEK